MRRIGRWVWSAVKLGGKGRFAQRNDFTPGIGNSTLLYARLSAPGLTTETRLIRKPATTVGLRSGRSWGGVVLDAAQKPVAGVTVEVARWSVGGKLGINPFFDDATENAGFVSYNESWKLAAQTDAAGRWRLDGLPASGRAEVKISDPRFVGKGVEVRIREGDAPPLFVRAGATISGVLVAPDGTPIEGARLSADFDGIGAPTTGADGRFTLTGIEPGLTTLRDFTSYGRGDKTRAPLNYVVAPLEKVEAVAGKTTDVGQWKAQNGVVITAKFVDAATKKPLQGVGFHTYFDFGNIIQSDAAGATATRTLSDGDGVSDLVGQAAKAGYVDAQLSRPKGDRDAVAMDLGTIELTRGSIVKGTVRIEGETARKAGLPKLHLEGNDEDDTAYLSARDGTGEFTTEAVKPGNYKVSLGSYAGADDENSGFEVVSPKSIKVPAPPADGVPATESKPVEIVVKQVGEAPVTLGEIGGRVIDKEGVGIAGAVITARLSAGYGGGVASAVSDHDGSFVLGEPAYSDIEATTVQITAIERLGYNWAGEPTVKTKDGATTIGNLVMRKSGSVFAGRITDENGAGAGGAWVGVVEARDFEPVQAGPDGSFELRDLPLDHSTLIAARGASYASVEANSAASGVTIKLALPPAPDREALADRALQGELSSLNLSAYWDILGAARLEKLVARSDRYRIAFALQLAQRDPQEFLRRAPVLLENATDDPTRAALTHQLHLTRAASENADERASVEAYLAAQKAVRRDVNAESARQLLELAEISSVLKRDDAASWLEYAAAINAQLGEGAGGNAAMGKAAARLGYDAAARFVEEFKPLAEFDFWSGASATLATKGDFAGARAALNRMQELIQTPALVEADKADPYGGPTDKLGQAAREVAVAVAKTDAGAALELLPTGGETYYLASPLLSIADSAIAANNATVAEKALRRIFDSKIGGSDNLALAASLAQQLDPKLGAELWDKARRRTIPDKETAMFGYGPDTIGDWAFYHAPMDGGLTRVLVEREWNWRLPLAVAGKGGQFGSEARNLSALELAMAAVDPARALQLREFARAQTGREDSADAKLAAAILATDAQRARLGAGGRG